MVSHFMEGVWNALPQPLKAQTDAYKDQIAERLIARDVERRVGLYEKKWEEDPVIAFLLAEGLLKVDQRSELSSIELSHDRLVKPVLEEYDARKQRAALEEQKRRDRKLVFAGVLIVLLAIMGALLLKGRDDQILAGQDTIRVQKDTVEEQKISFREYQETTAEPIADAARLYLALAQRAASENDTVRADSLRNKPVTRLYWRGTMDCRIV
jgi:hypothetical protein